MTPSTFGLDADVPEVALDPEWRALVRQQARTLAGMLQRFQTAVAGVPDRPDALQHKTLRLQALAAEAERVLTAQAQGQVSLERELVELRALVTDLSTRPAALAARVRTLESAIEVLHANLAIARQYLATLFPQEP